ncbi:MAG: hypothetical protein JNJ98_20750, partial [Gemmatimonadetes bacterium]|nr:hypothetical protein [Gemmatimonadota bacterium]
MRLRLSRAALAAVFPALLVAQERVDLLVRGGRVIDGTGAPARNADVGIRGDRIVFVGDAAARQV